MTTSSELTRMNPFPGLRAFRPEEGHLFFGRVESTTRVVNRLLENRFVAVIGASGSGKSSLVLSGVIPTLMKEDDKTKKKWSYITLRPELNPVENLARQLSELSSGPGFTYLSPAAVSASLNNRSEGIIDIVNKIRKNLRQQVLIVIDQFEEIFRYSPASTRGTIGDEATDFIDLIVNAARQPEQGLYIILTLRSEFVSECSRFHSLTNLLNSGSYLLPQLNRETLTSVIEEPVKFAGATLERGLAKTILGDLGEKPGQLAVLQHLLMRLWVQWSKSGDISRPIGTADYEAAGRIKGAISQHAGMAYNSLDNRHKYVCSRLFRSITLRTEEGKEVRKPEKLSTIAALTGCTTEEIKSVAEVFRSDEYSFITPAPSEPLLEDSIIDLSHESIIRLWGTLRKWMDDEASAQKLYIQLANAAESHQEGKGKLWGPPELLMAIKWRADNNPTLAWAEKMDPAFERAMLFLKNSEDEYYAQEEHNKTANKNKIKRSRLYAGFLGLLVVLCLIIIGAVLTLRAHSEKQKSIAVILKDEAIASNQQLSDSLKILSDTLKETTRKAEDMKAAAMIALNNQAEKQKVATDAKLIKEAVADKDAALKMASEEKRKKMISVARSLAVRSLTHTEEQDLQILLAWQAYLFNQRNAGASNDADIYSALYDVGKRYGTRYFANFSADASMLTSMAEEPGGKRFYASSGDGKVMKWSVEHPERGYDIVWSGDKSIEAMSVSPDASWLACGTESSGIIMIPLEGNVMGYNLASDTGKITALLFSNDGSHIFSSSENGNIVDWDLVSKSSKIISKLPEGVMMMDLSSDNKLLAGLTEKGKAILLRRDAGTNAVPFEMAGNGVTALAFIPGEDRLYTGDSEGNLELWDGELMQKIGSFSGHDMGISFIAFSPQASQMVTAGDDKKIKIWNIADLNETPAIIEDNSDEIVGLRFIEDGKAFLTATVTTLTERPAHIDYMVSDLCSKVSRNMTNTEWSAYVGSDIEYEKSCEGKEYRIRVNEIISANW